MLITVGNIFESKADVLVNAVNCVGIMGKGLALEFKRRYPDMFKEYAPIGTPSYMLAEEFLLNGAEKGDERSG